MDSLVFQRAMQSPEFYVPGFRDHVSGNHAPGYRDNHVPSYRDNHGPGYRENMESNMPPNMPPMPGCPDFEALSECLEFVKREQQHNALMLENHPAHPGHSEPPEHSGKKKKKSPEKLRLMRKLHRNSGKAYVTLKGKEVPAKVFRPLGQCKANCKNKLTEDEQKSLFDAFWDLSDYNKQNAFLNLFISISQPKSRRPRGNVSVTREKSKTVTCTYKVTINLREETLCKGCFMQVFSITSGRIRNIVDKMRLSAFGFIPESTRGKGSNPKALLDAEKKLILDHIESFPPYESYYDRKMTSKKYLGDGLSVKKMYELYKEKYGDMARSLSSYEKVFYSNGLHMKKPRKVTDGTPKKKRVRKPKEKKIPMPMGYPSYKAL